MRPVPSARLLFCAVACGVILAAAVPVAYGGDTAGASDLVQVLAPKDGGLAKGPSVRFVVREKADVDSFRAYYDGDDITRSFEPRGNRLIAELRVGSDLRPGLSYFAVRARAAGHEDIELVQFVVGRHSPGLLDFGGMRGTKAGSPMVAAVSASGLAPRVSGSLNGHRIESNFQQRPGGVRLARLGANDGARFGLNHIRVLAFDDRGRWDVEEDDFRIGRGKPLAGASPEGIIRAEHGLRLNAASSRPASAGARLSFDWTVLGRPRGSTAPLARAFTATPSFRPDVPGIYRLRVEVTEHHHGRTRVSHDLVVLDAQPDDPPYGVRLNTLISGSAMSIAGATIAGTGADRVSYAVISRIDRQPQKDGTGSVPNSLAGIQTIEQKIAAFKGPNYMVLIDGTAGLDPAALPEFSNLLSSIGASPTLNDRDRAALAGGLPFSVIGIAGAASDAAFTNFGRHQTPSDQLGRLAGLLQLRPYDPPDPPGDPDPPADPSLYGFTFADVVDFNTQQAHSATSNTMTVGGETYTPDEDLQARDPAATAGFHVLALDRRTLEPIQVPDPDDPDFTIDLNFAVPTNTGRSDNDALWASSLADLLNDQVLRRHALLLMQSIGNPRPTTDVWDDLSQSVEALGGTRAVFNALDGSGGYALVGAGGLDELQRVSNATGDWTLSYSGQTTDRMGQVSAAQLQSALEGLSTIAAGNVAVSGGPTGYMVRFQNDLGSRNVLSLNAGARGGAPPSVSVIQQGGLPRSYPQAELSGPLTGLTARLGGLLIRDHNADYGAPLTDNSARVDGQGGVRWQLQKLAYQAPQQFQPFTGEEADAERVIAANLKFYDRVHVRPNYYKSWSQDWGAAYDKINSLCKNASGAWDPASCGQPATFPQAPFESVRQKVLAEIIDLRKVKNLINNMTDPFNDKSAVLLDLLTIGQSIANDIQYGHVDTRTDKTLGMLLKAAAKLLPGGAAASAAGALAEGLEMAGSRLGPKGSPVLGQIQDETLKLAANTVARFELTRSGLISIGLIFASDPAKLATAADKAGSDWAWPADDLKIRNAIRGGTMGWYYTALLPIPWALWQLEPINHNIAGDPPLTNGRDYVCRSAGRGAYPFGAADSGQDYQVTSIQDNGSGGSALRKQVRVLGHHEVDWGANHPNADSPSGTTTDPAFAPLASGGAGLYKTDFYSPRNFEILPGNNGELHAFASCGS